MSCLDDKLVDRIESYEIRTIIIVRCNNLDIFAGVKVYLKLLEE